MSLWKKIAAPTGANANILIRLVVGGVFLNEGILKFLEPDALGVGRFAKIGLPYPDFLGPFVGTVEIVCGAMVILGLLTRPAAFALFINISVAIFTTKIPVLLGHGFLGFSLMNLPHYGFLSMVHEARTDFAMWFGLLFLLIAGPGRCSADALIART
jgi:uncharacterized membrane protein YphA (DoxX/SURF4 family)